MDNLQTQLDEVELLSAMFSHEGEFDPDYDAIEEVVPVGCRRINYAVCLPVGDVTCGVQEYVASLPTGEPTVVTIIQWLQTELPIFGENIVGEPITDEDSLPPLPTVPGLCVRQWVWFHHVRSKAKRASIQAWADELRLGGFLKIGKAHFVRFEELGEQDCGLVAQWLGTVGLAADFFRVIGMDVAANQS